MVGLQIAVTPPHPPPNSDEGAPSTRLEVIVKQRTGPLLVKVCKSPKCRPWIDQNQLKISQMINHGNLTVLFTVDLLGCRRCRSRGDSCHSHTQSYPLPNCSFYSCARERLGPHPIISALPFRYPFDRPGWIYPIPLLSRTRTPLHIRNEHTERS